MMDPGVLNWPKAQGKQKVWPADGVYWFAGQFKQLAIPVWLVKVPGEQGVGLVEPRGQKVPAGWQRMGLPLEQ